MAILSPRLRLPRRTRYMFANAKDRLLHSDRLNLAEQTPYEVLHDDGLVKLRYYPPLTSASITLDGQEIPVNTQQHAVPLVIVPPLAVNMTIYDLFPQRSFIKFLLAQGFQLYMLDWGIPRRRHAHYNLHTYTAELMPDLLARVRTHSGTQDLSLHGWSMGGICALCYTALNHDAHIRNLIVLGSPINSHASGSIGKMYQVLNRQATWVRHNTGFRIHNLNPQWLHTPGWMNVIGFKLMDPIGNLRGYWELIGKLADREFVINHATTSAFLDGMVAYPGGIVQDMSVRIWIDNELAKGYMTIGKEEMRLSDINCSLLVFAGKTDNMVTKAAVETLMDFVSSPDRDMKVVPGGHLGLVHSSKAPEHIWAPIANWLAARSK